MDHVRLAEELFKAFAVGDEGTIRSLCAEDFRARQNGGPPMDLNTLLGFALSVLQVVADFRYEEPVRSETASGFVEEHAVRGTLPDGSELDLPVCVVADVRDGRVSDVREYFDGVRAAGLASALS